MTEVVKII